MASSVARTINRAALPALLRAHVTKTPAAARPISSSLSPSRRRSIFLSRSPVELGCSGGSLLLLHSAVASARLTSRLSTTTRSCRDLSQEMGLSVPR
ncbi:hypothetical protein J5N97_018485 [Dioscorea zingiberensis]|uniref:Uncharacterized protein n=1 Tax=Dioscorea zingiberensis TaxID=325984 RepID=A0A9D5CCC7_9LILI|nr:hypothetical protein J5N97_018485 [Dioscorea zingiberensis]